LERFLALDCDSSKKPEQEHMHSASDHKFRSTLAINPYDSELRETNHKWTAVNYLAAPKSFHSSLASLAEAFPSEHAGPTDRNGRSVLHRFTSEQAS